MCLRIIFYVGLVVTATLSPLAHAESTDDSLKIYAVHIDRMPKQSWIGQGVYLGRGYVITAAHVAGLWFVRWPRVEIGGTVYSTRVVKDGHFHNIDLTLLSIDENQLPASLGLRRMPLCKNAPRINEPVVVATPEGVGRSNVMSPALLPPEVSPESRTVIRYTADTGNSGSGVFDADKKCLLGIITSKISQPQVTRDYGHPVVELHDIAKYFVPAAAIADFLPAEARF